MYKMGDHTTLKQRIVDCSSISVDPKAFSRRKRKPFGQKEDGRRKRRRGKIAGQFLNPRANPLDMTDQISLSSVRCQIFILFIYFGVGEGARGRG